MEKVLCVYCILMDIACVAACYAALHKMRLNNEQIWRESLLQFVLTSLVFVLTCLMIVLGMTAFGRGYSPTAYQVLQKTAANFFVILICVERLKRVAQGLFVVLLVFLCYSCHPTRRMERLCNRYPELCRRDTLYIRDTIAVPSVRLDTLLPYIQGKPIQLEKDRLLLRLKVYRDSLEVGAECKADTFYREHTIIQQKVLPAKVVPAPVPWYVQGLAWLGGLALVAVIGKFILGRF